MSSNTNGCKQLHQLHDRLTVELRELKESVEEEEREGTVNPIETINIIKSLQQVLSTVDLELQKCPEVN